MASKKEFAICCWRKREPVSDPAPLAQAVDHPVRVNQIPRQIPPIEWWLKPWPSALIAGVLPFGEPIVSSTFGGPTVANSCSLVRQRPDLSSCTR